MEKQVLKMYADGKTGDQIAKILGVGRWSVYKIIKESGAARPPWLTSRKHSINSSFFEVVDTEDKAYWLGFLAADGNVCGNLLQIDLKASDAGHLEKFRLALEATHPVKIRVVDYPQARFAVSSKPLVRSLARHGLLPKKSADIEPWVTMHPKLQTAYWRGLIDGDGSLSFSSGKWSISLNGSKGCCLGFQSWGNSLTGNSPKVRRGHGNVWQVCFSGDLSVGRITSELYADATVFLDRKMELAKKILERFECGDKRGTAEWRQRISLSERRQSMGSEHRDKTMEG